MNPCLSNFRWGFLKEKARFLSIYQALAKVDIIREKWYNYAIKGDDAMRSFRYDNVELEQIFENHERGGPDEFIGDLSFIDAVNVELKRMMKEEIGALGAIWLSNNSGSRIINSGQDGHDLYLSSDFSDFDITIDEKEYTGRLWMDRTYEDAFNEVDRNYEVELKGPDDEEFKRVVLNSGTMRFLDYQYESERIFTIEDPIDYYNDYGYQKYLEVYDAWIRSMELTPTEPQVPVYSFNSISKVIDKEKKIDEREE